MRTGTFCAILGIFAGAMCLLLFNPGIHTGLVRYVNQDVLYTKAGESVCGWIWDEKSGIVAGETQDGEIFVFRGKEYTRIERDTFLHLLRDLM